MFLDDQTGEPAWVTVKTGMFGGGSPSSRSPRHDAGRHSYVPYDKAKVKDAPRVDDSDGHLSRTKRTTLYRYYGLQYYEPHRLRPPTAPAAVGTSANHVRWHLGSRRSRSGHLRPDTDDAMTRSEEQLKVGTGDRDDGKARLRKYIVTENVTQTVPVSHEEVRIEREPITDANRGDAIAGGDITEEEHEVSCTRNGRGREGDRADRAGPAGHRDRHRGPPGLRGRPQGAHRGRHWRGHAAPFRPASAVTARSTERNIDD